MLNKPKILISLLRKSKRLILFSLDTKGYLDTIGWFEAFKKQQAIGHNGEPLPWVTYSFIDFIKPRLNNQFSIFEYGSGNSTLFYAKNVKRVVSVEHDETWYKKIMDKKAPNTEMIFTKLERGGEYCQKASLLGEKFDIIIVDGRDRVNCCKYSINALSKTGVIVLDDSERESYQGARVFLTEKGFKEISFSGISPGLFYLKATSVFYKNDNCLGI